MPHANSAWREQHHDDIEQSYSSKPQTTSKEQQAHRQPPSQWAIMVRGACVLNRVLLNC